jgi:class 3 adenylate cyclase
MAVAGLLSPLPNPAAAAVACGLELARAAATHGEGWRLRVGVHAGPVSAGVIGRQKYQYDVWGDTVNIASRMEQAAPPGRVCVEASTWVRIAALYAGESLGVVSLKGKGEREIFRITGTRNAQADGEAAVG